MDNPKSVLRHEILNIITILNFLVDDSNIPPERKIEMLNHLKMVSLLTAEEKIFLAQKKGFFIRELDLMEVLDMLSFLLEKEIHRSGAVLNLPKSAGKVDADFDVLKKGLEQLFLCLLFDSKKIEVDYDEPSRQLCVAFDGDFSIEKESGELIELLNKGLDHATINLQVSLHLMEMSGLKLVFEPGRVMIQF